MEQGEASRDSTRFDEMKEGLISIGGRNLSFLSISETNGSIPGSLTSSLGFSSGPLAFP